MRQVLENTVEMRMKMGRCRSWKERRMRKG